MYIFCETECVPICQVNENTLELKRILKDNLRSKQDIFKSGSSKHDRVSVAYCDKYLFYVQILTYYTTGKTGTARMEAPLLQREVWRRNL